MKKKAWLKNDPGLWIHVRAIGYIDSTWIMIQFLESNVASLE
jgi:hypothetical protein